jgi:hypothetical protein
MNQILTRCGYRCDLCLAYRSNVESSPSNPQVISDGWFRYFGFRIPPEEIICDGCMAENPRLIDKECPVRPCVIERELENCAHCEEFGCERLRQRLVTYESVVERIGDDIPGKDRAQFIAPYENVLRLETIRKQRE